MKIELTRAFIISAIKNEPADLLRGGAWIRGRPKLDASTCTKCAVGAVVFASVAAPLAVTVNDVSTAAHAAIAAEEDIGRTNPYYTREYGSGRSVKHQALRQLRSGRPLHALSLLFEDCATNRADLTTDAIKDMLIQFVESNFPASIVIDIDGIAPAKKRGVRVVKEKRPAKEIK